MRYFVYLSYKGTDYHGWQRQENAPSVQQTLEDAFSVVLREPVSLTGAGRTDTGVHARMMVAHFDAAQPLADTEGLVARLNNFLPRDITLQRILPVKEDAHARFDALSRKYEYYCTESKTPFYPDLVTRIPKGLDFDRMNQAAELLLSAGDFASFCKLHSDVKTTICHVTRAEWLKQGELWVFVIEANRFLRNMVRAVVGTLFEVGRGRLTVDDFRAVIDLKKREAAGQSAPAEGLYLADIKYPPEIFL